MVGHKLAELSADVHRHQIPCIAMSTDLHIPFSRFEGVCHFKEYKPHSRNFTTVQINEAF